MDDGDCNGAGCFELKMGGFSKIVIVARYRNYSDLVRLRGGKMFVNLAKVTSRVGCSASERRVIVYLFKSNNNKFIIIIIEKYGRRHCL